MSPISLSQMLVLYIFYLAYNSPVPTPFYHISVALDLLKSGSISEPIHHLLQAYLGAFLFGSTAPDVQVVSGQPRELTHFFEIPFRSDQQPAWEKMLAYYPVLAHPENLSLAQVAFIAGYLCHLQADWLWIQHIYWPVFGPQTHWATFGRRLFLHNVLRSYIDRQILPGLNHGISNTLLAAHPTDWLPFVEDRNLTIWRDGLAKQLQPSSVIRTVDVFAKRQGISPQEYLSLLESEERMEQEVFARLPRVVLADYRQHLLGENISLLAGYLGEINLVKGERR